ncbi:MAG: hypothetical protein AAGD43_04690 [Pseudomonadota bacterium]
MSKKDQKPLLPPREGECDEEQRLREAINRHAGSMLSALDAAIFMRNAPPDAQRARHLARGHMLDFALKAMHARSLAQTTKPDSAS